MRNSRDFAWIFLITATVGQVGHAAIWGADDRKESFEYLRRSREYRTSRSVAMVVPWSRLTSTPQGITLNFSTYGKEAMVHEEPLCASERFQKQPASLYSAATGFLVTPQLFVTAGHVIPSAEKCRDRAIVFGVEWNPKTQAIRPIPEGNVFACESIVKSDLQEEPLIDYTILRLSRPAKQFAPLAIRRRGKISSRAAVFMAGHPFGLPLKITGGGVMKDNSPRTHFIAFLDTYRGNSGSPVIDPATGLVEGVLVEGEGGDTTLEGDWPNGCWRSKVFCHPKVPFSGQCDDHDGSGAKVIRSTLFAHAIE